LTVFRYQFGRRQDKAYQEHLKLTNAMAKLIANVRTCFGFLERLPHAAGSGFRYWCQNIGG